jgi:hypothetical protein
MINIPTLRAATPARQQQGATSLVVVAILFVAMALIVGFSNHSILFEQKTAANQYRSTLAFEAAEAGMEWAQAMLNKPEYIDTGCSTSTVVANGRFKERYLLVNTTTLAVTPRVVGGVVAACAFNQSGGALNCRCPVSGTAPATTAPNAAGGFTPGFAVAFVTNAVNGTVDLVSYGCTSVINNATCTGDASATVRVSLGQASGLSTPPAAPLTARGNVSIGNAALVVTNPDPNTNGVTINAGGAIDASDARITTVPGTPPKSTLVGNDNSLRSLSEEGMFGTFFGMSKEAYKTLPATKILSCNACSETDIRDAYNSGARQMWVPGNLTMNANLTIGDATDPFVLIVDGSIAMRGDLRIFAVVYSTAITWDSTGGGNALLQGAAISEGNYTGNGTPAYYYDPNVMARIRGVATSFIKVPGSWRDF